MTIIDDLKAAGIECREADALASDKRTCANCACASAVKDLQRLAYCEAAEPCGGWVPYKYAETCQCYEARKETT